MRRIHKPTFIRCLLFLAFIFPVNASGLAAITSPQSYLGFAPGENRHIADWNQIVGYFQKLAGESGRVRVMEPGKTTMGRPFLQVLISSESNLANMQRYQDIESQLADSRRVSEAEADRLAREGKIFIGISCSIHSTEIAASQMSMQLAFDLASGVFPHAQEILDNVIIVLFPSTNPDGIQIVADWYKQQLGTPFEGTAPPFLYNKYVGHDDNRDFFKLTQIETQMVTKALWKDWHPAIYWDVHQMGSFGPRLFVPPYSDPTNPNIDPLIIRELFTLGGYMTGALAARQKPGVITMDRFDAWWVGGNRITPWYHNSVGILTEAASARLATPIDVTPEQLSGRGPGETFGGTVLRDPRNFLENTFNFPTPWPGGPWRLRDIVDYEMIAAQGLLRAAANEKEYFLKNFYRVTKNTVEEGAAGHPYAYVIPSRQHDRPTAVNLVNLLTAQGVEVFVAPGKFGVDGKSFDAGSYIIPLNQPYGRLVKTLFERQHYPDRHVGPNNVPERPYDVTGWTLPLMMGVQAEAVDSPFSVPLSEITQEAPPPGRIVWTKGKTGKYGFVFGHETNNSLIAMNRLQKLGYTISWIKTETKIDGQTFQPGAVFIPPVPGKQSKKLVQDLEAVSRDLSLTIYALPKTQKSEVLELKTPRVGLYKSWVPSMDEGWTRFLFDKFQVPYQTVVDTDVRQGNLNSRFDVLVLPQQSAQNILDGNRARSYPDQYVGGMGDSGTSQLRTFVSNGGTLIALDSASDFVIQKMGIAVTNVLQGLKSSEFYCPGTLLSGEADITHPIAYGMSRNFSAMFDNSRAFETRLGKVVARYSDQEPFQSGWLIGPQHVAGKAAVVELQYGKGKIILMGFRTQFRAWTDGSFKLLFNALFYGAAGRSTPAIMKH